MFSGKADSNIQRKLQRCCLDTWSHYAHVNNSNWFPWSSFLSYENSMLRRNIKLYINWESIGRNLAHFRNVKVVYVCFAFSNSPYFLASQSPYCYLIWALGCHPPPAQLPAPNCSPTSIHLPPGFSSHSTQWSFYSMNRRFPVLCSKPSSSFPLQLKF